MTDEQMTVYAEIEGDRLSWWYVCSECHAAIDQKDRICQCCGGVIDWSTAILHSKETTHQ